MSKDGRLFATGSSSGCVKIWTATGSCIWTFEAHSDMVVSTQFSTDSQMLASWSHDRRIKIWNLARGVCKNILECRGESILALSFSEDDRFLVAGSYDKNIDLWDTIHGSLLRRFEGHSDGVSALTFSSSRKWLVSGSILRGEIKIWDLGHGECLQTFIGHDDSVSAVAMPSVGSRLASSSCDGSIKVWDLSGRPMLIRTFHSRVLPTSLAFNSAESDSLKTNIGTLCIDQQGLIDTQPTYAFFEDVTLRGWGVDSKSRWILKGGNRVFQLPKKYHPSHYCLQQSTLAVGTCSGDLLLAHLPSRSLHNIENSLTGRAFPGYGWDIKYEQERAMMVLEQAESPE
ncbi:WD domain, g-beta repeat domain-containing protein [Purpureocillium lilacinum]|uniref:WD domain, g-beta repeat domain-containing protein n=1 Tax=Purpureocillium lilacinum TaxID=33203 RepID=A0A179EXZ6_PURLI|nr:WD domain, g-beta repeat domain-containing protein [Purpureocillium lilacinum]OAQ58061.1 WD domain, g-beta repeat domain-containing protein [Purpureocillium lilacinum]